MNCMMQLTLRVHVELFVVASAAMGLVDIGASLSGIEVTHFLC